jgi:MFS superfamily sulfate permease-like transporter
LQLLLGWFKLGGFTHFIPAAVIKGMLSAIGVILIAKQIPLLIGYDQPDFWRDELVNLLTFSHGFEGIKLFYESLTPGALVVALFSAVVMFGWQKWFAKKLPLLPGSFVVVLAGSLCAFAFQAWVPSLALRPEQMVALPANMLASIDMPSIDMLFANAAIWKYGVILCFVASLETLLSVVAVDKLDPYNRITPQNRELVAQGAGNIMSGLMGGLPITAVIVRSSANAEAGARTRMSAIMHALWLLLAVVAAVPLINYIPYCVLAVILSRTGYNLVKPAMIKAIWRQGREQFLPFLVTVIAILFTDLLIGVLIGVVYALYFLMKHTYQAGFEVTHYLHDEVEHYKIVMEMNVSFLNKKRFAETLDKIPIYSVVIIDATHSLYIDNDILEIIHEFKPKAHAKHIELHVINMAEPAGTAMH